MAYVRYSRLGKIVYVLLKAIRLLMIYRRLYAKSTKGKFILYFQFWFLLLSGNLKTLILMTFEFSRSISFRDEDSQTFQIWSDHHRYDSFEHKISRNI
jgi:hypothetical protein